jgi:uncharacterized protein (TIGR03437 family)
MARLTAVFHKFFLFCSLIIPCLLPAQTQLAVVSAANYQSSVAPGSIAAVFGSSLATTTESAQLDSSGQLPTQLGGTTVTIDGQAALLIYVSPRQINLVVPEGTQLGTPAVLVSTINGRVQGTATVRKIAPALFSSNGSGAGPGAILNAVTYAQGPFLVETSENGGDDKRTRLAVYATGIRLAGESPVRAQARTDSGNALDLPVEYAGPAPGFFGLDQVNVVLPAQADGLSVHLSLTAESVISNSVDFSVASLPANRVGLAGLTLSKTIVKGGDPVSATVSLNAASPARGIVVQLLSTNGAIAKVPALVMVPEHEFSVDVPIQTSPPLFAQDAQISAAVLGVTRSATLRVNPSNTPSLSGISVNAARVTNGGNVQGTVTISANAPFGGVSVALQSDNASLMVPAGVTIPFGQTSASFTATTTTVADVVVAKITATLEGVSQSASITVNPTLILTLTSDTIAGGSETTARVTLSDPAPTGSAIIQLQTSDPAVVRLPASVTITAGQTSADFTIQTTPPASDRAVVITATYRGASQGKTLTVTSGFQIAISKLEIVPTTVKGGMNATGTVTLNQPAGFGGVRISLTSDNILVAAVDVFALVPAGQTSGTFTIRTSPVASPRVVNITAATGGAAKTAALTVN